MLNLSALEQQYKSYGTLPVAPVREAVLGFHFLEPLSQDFLPVLEELLPLYKWSKLIPTSGSLVINMLTSETTHHQEQDHSNTQYRGDLTDENQSSKEVLILKPGSFNYHLLGSYTQWDHFFDKASELWHVLSKLFGFHLQCHSTRFVNEIAQQKTLQEYAPAEFSNAVLELNYLTSTSNSLCKVPSLANFIQVASQFWPTGADDQGHTLGSYILDISIWPDLAKNDLENWATAEELRVLKNYFFFSSLPPQVLHLCR